MYLNLKSEYSFRSVFAHTSEIIQHCRDYGSSFAGIADINNSFGHVTWQSQCREVGIKPIFGVTLPVFYDMSRVRRLPENVMTFIALNMKGLREIYRLIDLAHQNFYYKPRIAAESVNGLSKNVLILSGLSPDLKILEHDNLYLQLSPDTPNAIKDIKSIPSIACCDNYFVSPGDRVTYQKFADERLRDKKTTIQFIPSYELWLSLFPKKQKALENLFKVSEMIDFDIVPAPMIKADAEEGIKSLCKKGAKAKGLNIKEGVYGKRFKREMKLIFEKGYVDYFLVVADLVQYAKTKMCVGPARGSSAGSLVCYLLGITEIDPIQYNLYFERFIDVNRHDLPDIDIDFQDDKRNLIINYLKKKYGENNIAQIANISRLKPKSSLIRFAKALKIFIGDVEELKNSITGISVEKALKETEAGKTFIESFPNMHDVHRIENHALHSSVHAAGILVSTKPTTYYCGINSREKGQRIAMINKRDAEAINLLKIDALGLRTLTIIADICNQIGKPCTWIYNIPLDDKKAYKMFNSHRYNGIFQFEGESAIKLAKKMTIKTIEDLSVISAICRPGALLSGGANRYIKRRNGKESFQYLDSSEEFIRATENTFGVIVYQEQVMQIAREYAGLSWSLVSDLRKAVSKSKGLDKFEKIFLKGCKKKGHKKQNSKAVWEDIKVHGSYSFNISHSISYSIISYITAYLKAHYPLEFTVASLNHAKDDNSALKFLRDMVENEKIKYSHYNSRYSVQKWTASKGFLYGSLLSIDGIGLVAANKIVKSRREGTPLPPGIKSNLKKCVTPFRYLYPAKELYGEFYKKGKFYQKVTEIKKIKGRGTFLFIGKIVKKNVRDMNEPALLIKRGGNRRESPTTFLQLVVEDDTDSILCSIWPEQYEDYGVEIAETGKEDKTWLLIEGEIKSNQFRAVNITNIKDITK